MNTCKCTCHQDAYEAAVREYKTVNDSTPRIQRRDYQLVWCSDCQDHHEE